MKIVSEITRNSRTVRYRKNGHKHYSVDIYIVDDNKSELEGIECVKYELHSSFKDPVRYASDYSSGFRIRIRTWGFFQIKAEILFKDGKREKLAGEVKF